MLDNQLNRQASELVNGQKEDSIATQFAPTQKMSILDYIRLDEAKNSTMLKSMLRTCAYLMTILGSK